MKRIFFKLSLFILASIATLNLTSCKDNDNDDLQKSEQSTTTHIQRGVVAGFDSYGMLEPSFTVEEMKKNGFDYADLIDVKIGNDIVLENVPFVTGFNEVGVFETCLCDYNALGTTFGFGQLHGNFKQNIGGQIGDSILITVHQKQGYRDTYKVMHSVYDTERSKYGSNEQFANFREVTTSGMGKARLYRSSNPLNPSSNAVRYAVVDRLAEKAGIQTEIDLADTNAKIEQYMTSDGFQSTYCPALYRNNQVIALGLDASVFSENFKAKLQEGLRFMINHEAPYLVHCNEGKDRCGFVSLLLEALAGATYDEVADDYMVTISNFYLVKKGDHDYNVRKQLSVDRLVWLLGNYKTAEDIPSIDWNSINPNSINLQKAAHDYVIDCGLSETECNQLIHNLTGK